MDEAEANAVVFLEIVPFTAEVVGKFVFVPWSMVRDSEGAAIVEDVILPVPILLATFAMDPKAASELDGIVIVEEYVM